MLEFRKELPRLESLVAFEAAARHASFAQAAKELNVTASAVSQQIRALETQLGISLFDRAHRSVQLTALGKEFQNSVSVALMHLLSAAAGVRMGDRTESVVIATDTSIAAQWLIPRLACFEARFPDIALRIRATDVQSDMLDSTVQIALIHGDGKWRGHVSELLFEEEIFPVCSPGYLDTFNGEFSLEDLAHAKLLDLDYENWHWMNWAIWFTEMSLPLPDPPRKLRLNNYPLMIEAAKRGVGVALDWRYLIDEDLADGSLVRPVKASIKTRYGYYIAWPYNQKLPPAVEVFKDWLVDERNSQLTDGRP